MAQQETNASAKQTGIDQDIRERLQLDYEQTIAYFNLLADTRFKLLAFVPTLSGIAIALVSSDKLNQSATLALGVLGFIVTLGIIIYELRNTLFYEMSSTRASLLERLLEFPRFSLPELSDQPGGMFEERGSEPAQKLVGVIPVKHDRGLALIYGASLGGWVYIAVSSLLPRDEIYIYLSLFIAVVIAILTIVQFGVLEKQRSDWRHNNVKNCNLYRGNDGLSASAQHSTQEGNP